jgi:hypothetical protein
MERLVIPNNCMFCVSHYNETRRNWMKLVMMDGMDRSDWQTRMAIRSCIEGRLYEV